jgi:hypothetical protein
MGEDISPRFPFPTPYPLSKTLSNFQSRALRFLSCAKKIAFTADLSNMIIDPPM